MSSAAPTGANRCAQCSQVAACPWPEPPAGPHRRTEEEALHRRIEGAHAPSHKHAGPACAALLWIHVHLQDPTSVAHLSHVFAPRSPPAAALYRARSTMPRRRGDGPGHARARRQAQEAAVRRLVADAVTEAHEAQAAAKQLDRQCEGFPQRGRPPGRPRPERSRGPYAAPSDAPDRECCPAGGHQPAGCPLRALDGVAHVQPVRPAPFHGGHPAADERGVRHVPPQQGPSPGARPQDALPWGHGPVPEPGAGYAPRRSVRAGRGAQRSTSALEVGEITVLVEGADEAPTRFRSTNPVCDGARPTPPYAVVCEAFPREPAWCPVLPPATQAPGSWANPHLFPPLSHHRGQVLWQERPGTPLLLLVVATRGDPEQVLEITLTHPYGAAPPAPPSRRPRRGTG